MVLFPKACGTFIDLFLQVLELCGRAGLLNLEHVSLDGSKVDARRKVIVEPVFGQVKQARGFRQFSLRGHRKVAAEWSLVCLCSNLLKLVSAQQAPVCP
jgi:hypothetical protein